MAHLEATESALHYHFDPFGSILDTFDGCLCCVNNVSISFTLLLIHFDQKSQICLLQRLVCHGAQTEYVVQKNECNTCDFNFQSFDFNLDVNFEINRNQILKTNKADFKSVFINLFNTSNQNLRAPPSMS